MGVCASCLGRRRNNSIDEDDVSRLLMEDENHMQYGSFAEHNMNAQGDPLESQREAEALQRVVARTSNNLVDVFEINPEESQRAPPLVFPAQDARLARYQQILSVLSSDDATPTPNQEAAAWLLSEEDSGESPGPQISIKPGTSGPLVGTFADAITAIA